MGGDPPQGAHKGTNTMVQVKEQNGVRSYRITKNRRPNSITLTKENWMRAEKQHWDTVKFFNVTDDRWTWKFIPTFTDTCTKKLWNKIKAYILLDIWDNHLMDITSDPNRFSDFPIINEYGEWELGQWPQYYRYNWECIIDTQAHTVTITSLELLSGNSEE